MRRAGLLAALLAAAGPALAADTAAESAAAAARQIEAAAVSLSEARGARDRVRALTRTVQAYEVGLAALRAGLRQASQREAILSASLEARRAENVRLLAALATMGPDPAGGLLLHPDGPAAAARAGLLLTEVAPQLQAEIGSLRAALTEIADLRRLQEAAEASMTEALAGAQQARTELSQAMSARSNLPRRFAGDPARMEALLAEDSETLDAFAEGLAAMPVPDATPPTEFAERKGNLPWPVRGPVLRGFGEADPAGIARPGLVIAARPGALITAPSDATIRYLGPLLDYGNVMILEPETGFLMVLAGMDRVYGAEGEIVRAGEPLGLMGGVAAPGEVPADGQENGGAGRSETLYLELRQGEAPVDPTNWFVATDKG